LDAKPNKEFAPIGYEAESFAHKYRDVFEQKVAELEKENILQSLGKIEASLNNLTSLVKSLTQNYADFDNVKDSNEGEKHL
jgi:hypothetical protein